MQSKTRISCRPQFFSWVRAWVRGVARGGKGLFDEQLFKLSVELLVVGFDRQQVVTPLFDVDLLSGFLAGVQGVGQHQLLLKVHAREHLAGDGHFVGLVRRECAAEETSLAVAVKSEASYFPCAVYGQMLVSAQEYESAFGFLLDAALDASAEENTAVWLRAASAARLAGRANEARGMLGRILGANEPEFRGEACYEMGLLEEEAGKPDRALANFGRALSSSPPFEGAAIPLAQTLLMNARDPEDFRRARQLAKRAGITTTDEASTRMLLGVSTWLAGDRATGTKILGEVFEREKEFRSNPQILAARRLLLEATVATTHDDLIRSWRRADRRLQTLLAR